VNLAGTAARTAWRATRRGLGGATRRDPTRLRRQLRPDPNWREPLDGAAPRLRPDQRIEVTRVSRFRQIDPYRTVEGWRDVWRLVGLAGWAAAVAAAWWLGSSRGKGPLAILAEEHERAF
jgi:hypothetical protein